jgi:hypothetical protein
MLAALAVAVPGFAFAGPYHDLAREPHGIETPVPESVPAPPAPAAKKITIYTAKTIVTLDPGTPTAEAVAVMDGKILGVGTLDEVKSWVTDEDVEIDQRFKDAVIVPGFIEAHMHPQITGILWQGVYVGRFDGVAPRDTGQRSGDQPLGFGWKKLQPPMPFARAVETSFLLRSPVHEQVKSLHMTSLPTEAPSP